MFVLQPAGAKKVKSHSFVLDPSGKLRRRVRRGTGSVMLHPKRLPSCVNVLLKVLKFRSLLYWYPNIPNQDNIILLAMQLTLTHVCYRYITKQISLLEEFVLDDETRAWLENSALD